MTWEDIPGWFNFQKVYDDAVLAAPPGGLLVELGCWLGRSTAYLAGAAKRADKGLIVVAVDHGVGEDGKDGGAYRDVIRRHGGNSAGVLAANLAACGVQDVVV